MIEPAIATLMSDCPPSIAEEVAASLRPQAKAVFEAPGPKPAWAEAAYAGRRGYIRCTLDNTLPPFLQEVYLQGSEVEWQIQYVEACHDAFLSKPAEVAELVMGFADGFQKLDSSEA